MAIETVRRIEPARPEEASEAMSDVIADLAAAASKLGQAFHPRTAANLAGLVIATGLLASETPKGAVSLRFPADALDVLFPRLFAEAS